MNEYKIGFGVGLMIAGVLALIISQFIDYPQVLEASFIPIFLGIVLIGYSIFSPVKYSDNPCECGHKDFYHYWDLTSRKECESCNCRKFKERVLPELSKDEFMSFEEWKDSRKQSHDNVEVES